MTASVAAVAAAAPSSHAAPRRQRVFIGSGTADGILAYDWHSATGELKPAGVAATLANVDWITFSPDRKFIFAASEVDSFDGKPTGEVASFSLAEGVLKQLSAQNSAGKGTCHVAVDHGGRTLLSADYGGGSAASFLVTSGKLSPAVWTEHYTGHGPNADRQESAHAHFASFSPDDRFAYINDLGGDCIHIYSRGTILIPPGSVSKKAVGPALDTLHLTPAGVYKAKPGAGPRTLHFHPNGHTAYSINELDSTVDVVEWSKADGSLTLVTNIQLLPAGFQGKSTACDTVISGDGRHVYFANRFNDFIYGFNADVISGALTPIKRFNCGGKTPRNFVLDPTERWMLVANQDSNTISVFGRDAETGVLADEGKSFAAARPMCILFA